MKKLFTNLLILLFVAVGWAQNGYEIGDKASDFSLKNVNGKVVSLVDYPEAKGFLVIFTCNTCPYAQAYEDRIIELHTKYAPKDVPVIAINPNNPVVEPGESFKEMIARADAKEMEYPYLVDEGQKVFPLYGATRTPHVFLLEKTQNGNIVRYIGAIDDNYQNAALVEDRYVEDAVNAMLAGKQIEVTTTKAIGCSIKI
ncbi:thioredoxin family protein [Flavobacterium sp. ASW18X]|uniref:thioredoxin family protein n=1 Tax=Flavobacterium sp. ASW18X TaxID=2572595 RepID=UPI0010ADA7FB|nr:thioredoxin family protein [Flavobacterium sp. ASW18X]TKD59077.1 thioredoxin family protein [Flavobacterium sp. ASW18X]